MMIKIGNGYFDEAYIEAIVPAVREYGGSDEPGREMYMVQLTGGKVLVLASDDEVRCALEAAGLLDPPSTGLQMDFTAEELEVLKALYEIGFRFVAKDDSEKLFAYTGKPTKGIATWINDDDVSIVQRVYCRFDALSFDDDEPLDISSVLDRLGAES